MRLFVMSGLVVIALASCSGDGPTECERGYDRLVEACWDLMVAAHACNPNEDPDGCGEEIAAASGCEGSVDATNEASGTFAVCTGAEAGSHDPELCEMSLAECRGE